jgi:hypothetical protein
MISIGPRSSARGGVLVNEIQDAKVRARIAVWSVALGASLLVTYFFLFLLLSALSSGRDLFSLSFHWLSISLVVAAVLHYFWLGRVAPELGRYRTLAFIGIHVVSGILAAIIVFSMVLGAALSRL